MAICAGLSALRMSGENCKNDILLGQKTEKGSRVYQGLKENNGGCSKQGAIVVSDKAHKEKFHLEQRTR